MYKNPKTEYEQIISILSALEGFEWDEGNRDKNKKHKVEHFEIEQVFFDPKILIIRDIKHSFQEKRFIAFGMTSLRRMLTVVFTVRRNKIRAISARDASRKERTRYEEET